MGQGDPALGAVVTGEVNGEHLVYGVNRVAGENVGDYDITVTFDPDNAVNKNYAITTVGAKFTITKAACHDWGERQEQGIRTERTRV